MEPYSPMRMVSAEAGPDSDAASEEAGVAGVLASGFWDGVEELEPAGAEGVAGASDFCSHAAIERRPAVSDRARRLRRLWKCQFIEGSPERVEGRKYGAPVRSGAGGQR